MRFVQPKTGNGRKIFLGRRNDPRASCGDMPGHVEGRAEQTEISTGAYAGIAFGTVGSLGAARLIASLLFATSPWDPIAFAAMATSLTAIALLSGYFPARRASKIQPMDALRSN